MYNEDYQTPSQIIKLENQNKTFGLDEHIKINGKNKVESFQQLLLIEDGKEAQEALLEWVKQYSDSELAKMWRTIESRVKRVRSALALVKNKRGDVTIEDNIQWDSIKSLKNLVLKRENPKSKNKTVKKEKVESKKEDEIIIKQVKPVISFGFNIKLEGMFVAQDAVDRLDSYMNLLMTLPDSKFLVRIEIEESA